MDNRLNTQVSRAEISPYWNVNIYTPDKIQKELKAEISPYWNVNGNPCCSVAVETPCRNLTILECKCEKIVGSVVTIGAGILPYWNGNFVNESKYSSGS